MGPRTAGTGHGVLVAGPTQGWHPAARERGPEGLASPSVCPALPPGAPSGSRGPARSGWGVAVALMPLPGRRSCVCSSRGAWPAQVPLVSVHAPRGLRRPRCPACVSRGGQPPAAGPCQQPPSKQSPGHCACRSEGHGGARGRLALRGAGSAGEAGRLCPRAVAALISGQLALHIMRVGQLDASLEAAEKLPAIACEGTRAKQSPANCMKHSARRKAGVHITLQNVMETEVTT